MTLGSCQGGSLIRPHVCAWDRSRPCVSTPQISPTRLAFQASEPRQMNSLPDVLLQLVCQALPSADLLHLARCSTQMRHASPFAWASNVIFVSMRHFSLDSCPATTLARHAGVLLCWDIPASDSASVEELLTKVSLQFPRIVELDVQHELRDRPLLSNTDFAALLSHPAMRRIHTLALMDECIAESSGFHNPPDLVLPHLRSLRVHCEPASCATLGHSWCAYLPD